MSDERRHFWIGVASRSHVAIGVQGGFALISHGKAAPLRRLHAGDWLIYYSPKTRLDGGEPLQAFTAIGSVVDDVIYQHEMSPDFIPYRRDVQYYIDCREAPIQPLIDRLDFIRDKHRWGYPFRQSLIEVSEQDFLTIAEAMGVPGTVTFATVKG